MFGKVSIYLIHLSIFSLNSSAVRSSNSNILSIQIKNLEILSSNSHTTQRPYKSLSRTNYKFIFPYFILRCKFLFNNRNLLGSFLFPIFFFIWQIKFYYTFANWKSHKICSVKRSNISKITRKASCKKARQTAKLQYQKVRKRYGEKINLSSIDAAMQP